MPWMIPAAIIGSSLLGSSAASSAADTQAGAARDAAALQNEQYQQTRQDQMPFMQAGVRALGKLESAADYTPFEYNAMTADPGYKFRLGEGQRALAHQTGARGGLVSGQSLKAMQDYAQGAASNEYTNAFNRYQIERTARLAPLQSLVGVGQTTGMQLGQTGAANATNVGNLMTGGAAASAAGTVGAANALTAGTSTYLNYNQGNNLLAALRGGGRGTNMYGDMPTPTNYDVYDYQA